MIGCDHRRCDVESVWTPEVQDIAPRQAAARAVRWEAAMAPNALLVEWQTSQIIKYLFDDDDDDIALRKIDAGLEVDGPSGSEG